MKRWQCIKGPRRYDFWLCGFIYDEELGLPEEGLAPGTAWEDITEDWLCPDCGMGKDEFEMIEV